MAKLLLVIDDNPDQRRFLERTLQAAGYRVVSAPDEATDLYWAHEVGADAFLTKPVDLPDLLGTIEGLAGRG